MKITGKALKYGDNINTDGIIPARYLNTSDEQELGKHCMEDLDKDFLKKAQKGDVIVAGKNFGCGSSREHAPVSIKAAGISCVIAESFARIFFRNAINIGLPIIESKEASKKINDGDTIEIVLSAGVIKNLTSNQEYEFQAFPEFLHKIIGSGGLVNFIKKQ